MKSKQHEILLWGGYVAPVSKVVELQSEGVLCGSNGQFSLPTWQQDPDEGLNF